MKNREFKEENGPLKRPQWSEIFAALELLQNCNPFEKELVAFHLQSHLDKFSVFYQKALQSKKQQTNLDTFSTIISL